MYNITNIDNFELNAKIFTCGLIDTIPFNKVANYETGGFVWSGGLLYDTIVNRNQTYDKLSDIDLFFYGDSETKMKLFEEILLELKTNQYEFILGVNKAIVWIFIKGVPRIIQLIFTDKPNAQEIIDTFDFAHVQSYWTGTELYCKDGINEYFTNNQTQINYSCHPSRLIKYFRRNMDMNKFLYTEYDFILDSIEYDKFRKYIQQTNFYANSNNYMEFNPIKLEFLFNCKIFENIELNELMFDEIKNSLRNDNLKFYMNVENNPNEKTLNIFNDNLNVKPYRRNQMNCSVMHYQTQKYIYIPCKIFDIKIPQDNTPFDYFFHIEISKPRVKDYLLNLIENIHNDTEELVENDKRKKKHSYHYTHNFLNSIGYSNINNDSRKKDFIINSSELIYQFVLKQSDYNNQLTIGQNVFILFEIVINAFEYGNHNFKLRPKFIESDKFETIMNFMN
jgi:hypothetical protein